MIRPLGKLFLTFGALALLASPAWAQGRGGFGMGGGAGILMAENVQKDLKLTDEQKGKVQETLQASREKHRDDLAGLQDLSQEERQEKMASLNKTMTGEVKKALSFSDEQSKRFDQISLQARGLQAFADPMVVSKLKLTDDQKSKLREIGEAARGQTGGFNYKDASEQERVEFQKKMAASRKENMDKVHALLTDDQKKAWKDLTGEPITVQMPARRPNN